MAKIALDIGHAEGTGSVGNGIDEHSVANVISWRLFKILQERGHFVQVIDYPYLSNSADLNATIKEANSGGFDIGVSIHCDCSDNQSAHGAHVCYLSSTGKRLAELIAEPLTKLMPGRSEVISKRTNLAVLKQTKPTWVLCECGFVSNKNDAIMLSNKSAQIAGSIADGICKYLCVK